MAQKIDHRIEKLTSDRLSELSELDAGCFPESPWGYDSLKKTISSSYDSCLICIGDDERIAGYCIVRVLDEAELLLIATDEHKRRKGIAEAIMKKVFDICEEKKASYIFLEVREGNAAARKLYEKLGFSVISRRKNYYNSPVEDALIMRRPCGLMHNLSMKKEDQPL